MRQRSVHTELRKARGAEKEARQQTATLNAAREIPTARIESTKRTKEPVGRNIAVTTEKAIEAFPEIGDDHDIGLVVSGAGFQPCLPLTHLIGCSQVCVPVRAPDLQTTELVDQEEVDHPGNRVRAVHRRGAILQDVDVIDHREGKQVNVHASAEPGDAQRTIGDTFAIDQNQSLLGQQTAQVELDGAVTTVADVQVDSSARFLR